MPVTAFIGCGNMGGALARAAAKKMPAQDILLCNRSPEKAEKLAEELGAKTVNAREAAGKADILFLGVKPQQLDALLDEIGCVLKERSAQPIIVSMMAGKPLSLLKELFPKAPVVRIMPNIPVSIGAGVTLLCAEEAVTETQKEQIRTLLGPAGEVVELNEHLFDAAGGVTGCGPAFIAMFAEALSDGAVACGLPRAKALKLAEITLKGTAEYLLKTGEHPGALKDKVCSPAGSTIQGVRKLEEYAFRSAVAEAVIATYEKEF